MGEEDGETEEEEEMKECYPISDELLEKLPCRGHGCKLGKVCADYEVGDGRCLLNDILGEVEIRRRRYGKPLPFDLGGKTK